MLSTRWHNFPYNTLFCFRSEYGKLCQWVDEQLLKLTVPTFEDHELFNSSLPDPQLWVTARAALNLKDKDVPSTEFVREMAAPNRYRRTSMRRTASASS